ncbi:response regulator [Variovorax sp. HJSM1_2]|uniref:response regulator n=1 Tax=Variovorax sp. HJSM1_2 TaxID=3366263 RepID=UPI003BDD8802
MAGESNVNPQLLVVDDEPELRNVLSKYFVFNQFEVRTAMDAAEARVLLAQRLPDVMLIDVHMPGESGLSLARWLRETHPRVGLVMLTAASDTVDRIVGLELGADDYVTKPFEMRELLARMRSLLRRLGTTRVMDAEAAERRAAQNGNTPFAAASAGLGQAGQGNGLGAENGAGLGSGHDHGSGHGNPAAQVYRFGRCMLDVEGRRLLNADGLEVPITVAEYELLVLFARHPNRPLTRDQIMEAHGSRRWEVFDRSIDLRIMRLRRKVEPNPAKPSVLKTVRGVGYIFVPAG